MKCACLVLLWATAFCLPGRTLSGSSSGSASLAHTDGAEDALALLELGALRARLHKDSASKTVRGGARSGTTGSTPGGEVGKAKNAQDVIDSIAEKALGKSQTLEDVQKDREKAAAEVKALREKNAAMVNDLDALNVKHAKLSEDVETSLDKMRVLNAQVGFYGTESSKAAKQAELLRLQKQYDQLSASSNELLNHYAQVRTLRGAVYARMRKLHNEIVPLQSEADMQLRKSLDVPTTSNFEPRNPSEERAIDDVEDMLDDHQSEDPHDRVRARRRRRRRRSASRDAGAANDDDGELFDETDGDDDVGSDDFGLGLRDLGHHDLSKHLVVGVPHTVLPPLQQANLVAHLGVGQIPSLAAGAATAAGFGTPGGGATFNPMYPLFAPGAAGPALLPPTLAPLSNHILATAPVSPGGGGLLGLHPAATAAALASLGLPPTLGGGKKSRVVAVPILMPTPTGPPPAHAEPKTDSKGAKEKLPPSPPLPAGAAAAGAAAAPPTGGGTSGAAGAGGLLGGALGGALGAGGGGGAGAGVGGAPGGGAAGGPLAGSGMGAGAGGGGAGAGAGDAPGAGVGAGGGLGGGAGAGAGADAAGGTAGADAGGAGADAGGAPPM